MKILKTESMQKIAIFCSASDAVASVYAEKAAELGTWLGRHGKWLVYGGSNTGLMEKTARAAKEAGAMIMGVVPTLLEERGKVSDLVDVTFRTDNLSDRKDVLLRESDICVALPGGVGTLDEVFTVMASATIGYHDKKVVFYNVDGFWDDILRFLDRLEEKRFAHRPLRCHYEVARTLDELAVFLE